MKKLEMKQVKYATPEYEETVDFRDLYFRKPQGLDIRDDDLSSDKNSIMYGGYLDGELVATIYYVPIDKDTAQIKAVITGDSIRGKGYGKFIMNFIEDIIKSAGYKKIFMEARTAYLGFYEHLGYRQISKPYDIRTIPHVDMIKEI